jgi:hypothetical protein
VGYLYRTGFRQVGAGDIGKAISQLGWLGGVVYKACAGGITVLYSVDVSFPCVLHFEQRQDFFLYLIIIFVELSRSEMFFFR